MTPIGQSQRGGEGAEQYQAARDVIIYQSMPEERVREIARAVHQEVADANASEAHELIQVRVSALDNRVIEILGQKEQLGAFADPAFLRSYRKALSGAATTDRESDYDMLGALLGERASRPTDRPSLVGIDRAVEIVDQVEDAALRGLTVFFAAIQWRMTAPEPSAGIAAMEKMYGQLIDGPLPDGEEWLDHLDLLGAVRLTLTGNLTPFDQYIVANHKGWVAPGLPTAIYSPVVPGQEAMWGNAVGPHELKAGFSRVLVPSDVEFRNNLLSHEIDPATVDAVVNEAEEIFGLGREDGPASAEFVRRVREQPHVGQVARWWDQIPTGLQVTAAGKALARANAFRLDTAQMLKRSD